ncbi:MAG TPA: serine/threonine-protein kinase [Gaiellaceae bacterium]|nr:serine/threonine-protein kinase [Gaiellaceae bacterium]
MADSAPILPPRYRDAERVASGGMGDVYRATDTQLGRTVAVKVLAARYAGDEAIRERFTREALAAARLSGVPNTVTIFDVGEWEGRPHIVMEYLDGGTLENRLRAAGAQDPADVLRWLGQAAGALDAAHAAGIVHRDVKPGNLLLDGRGEVRVGDYGVASAVGLDSMTMTGTVLGTAGYLSPEQARGERATPASDRYALGVVAYELLTGTRPFASDSPTAEAAAHVHAPIPYPSEHGDVPPELDPVLRRALAKEPGERFPSAADFVASLRDALSRAAGTTRQLAPVVEEEPAYAAPAPSPARRGPNPWVWVAAALVLLLALGAGLAMAAILSEDEEPQTRTVVQTQVTTQQGRPTTVRETVTTSPATTEEPTTATTATTAPSDLSGEQLTDQATALLEQGRWEEAEAVSRQALAKLEGSGELYEAYANYNLGRALVEQGRCEEALPHLDRSEEIQGSRREIREARARCS